MNLNILEKFSHHIYTPAVNLSKGIPFRQAIAQANANQHRSTDEILADANRSLTNLFAHAYNTTKYYREIFDRIGVTPGDLPANHIAATLPILTKADVFERGKDMISNVVDRSWKQCRTSGSTGISMPFVIDGTHAAWTAASVYRGRGWWGIPRCAKEMVLWARAVDNSPSSSLLSALKYRLRNRHQFDTFVDFDDNRADMLVAALRKIHPKVLYGYGSSLGRLAMYMRDRGIVLSPTEAPVLAEYTADHMSLEEQEIGRSCFGCPVISGYGASEIGGVAQMCREGNLHISIDHVVVEIVGPNGQSVEPGEIGEIVITALNNKAMPFIRYAIGDVGRLSKEPCRCGLPFPTMVLELGKAVELIETSSAKGMSAHVFDYINLHLMKQGVRGIRQFFVEQTGRDAFVLTIVKDTVFEPACVDMFVAKMREKLGASVDVDVRFASDVPHRNSGKRYYFRKTF